MVQTAQQWLFSNRKAKAWGIAEELMVFSVYWNPGKVGSNTNEGMPQQQDR